MPKLSYKLYLVQSSGDKLVQNRMFSRVDHMHDTNEQDTSGSEER